jgi:hypothetical protein
MRCIIAPLAVRGQLRGTGLTEVGRLRTDETRLPGGGCILVNNSPGTCTPFRLQVFRLSGGQPDIAFDRQS